MKKLLLSLIAFLGVAMCSVVAYIGLSYTTPSAQSNNTNNSNGVEVNIDKIVPVEKPSTITYAPNTIRVQKGGDSINYNYTPDINQTDETTPTHTVAYEYCFGNPMTRKTAVNLKSIDTTGVNVSYYYSTSKIDTTETLVGETDFELQELEINGTTGDQVYIYVLVGPEDVTVPTTFTQSIVWYYGIPQSTPIIDNVTGNVIDTQTIVSGQKIDTNTFTKPTAPDGYYFDAWFTDKAYTQLADGTNGIGKNMYVRFANLPSDYLAWDSTTSSYYVKQLDVLDLGQQQFHYGSLETNPITNLVIPTLYNDNINGEACVTYVGSNGFTDNMINGNLTCFYKCETITLPCSITTLQNQAFSISDGWESTLIPSLTSIDLNSCINLTTIGQSAFYDCAKLTNITLPKSLTTIGDNAFSGCAALTSVNFKDGVKDLGESVFAHCTSLKEITIPGSLISTGSKTFYGCSALESVEVSEGVSEVGLGSFYKCSALKTIDIPTTVSVIGEHAFQYCSSLTSIDLNKCTSLTSIGEVAFYGCSSLTSVDLNKCTSLTSIGDMAFYGCSSLTSMSIPANVKSLGYAPFNKASRLESVDLSACINLTTIPDWAFSETGLTSIKLPSTITYIGFAAFNQCNFTTIDLRVCTNLQTIEGGAFCDCTELTSVILPATLCSMGYYDEETEQSVGVFAGCTALMSVTFNDTSTWYVTTDATVWANCDTSAATEVIGLTTTASNENATLLKTTYVGCYWFKVE